MRHRFKPYFFVLLILIALLATTAAAQESVPNDLIATYAFDYDILGGNWLTLNADGTFEKGAYSCGGSGIRTGTYTFSNGALHLTFLTHTITTDGKKIDLRSQKARKKYLGEDTPFKVETFDMYVVRWGERAYLLYPEHIPSFIEAVNLGFEPRRPGNREPMFDPLLLRDGDEDKPVSGAPGLPAEFLSQLLDEPIVVTVIAIDEKRIATVDRGSKDGLRKGTALVSDIQSHFAGFEQYRIQEITDHEARVWVDHGVSVGDKLTTRVKNVSR